MREMKRRRLRTGLTRVVGRNYSDRWLNVGSQWMEIAAGVPQVSVQGLILWILIKIGYA